MTGRYDDSHAHESPNPADSSDDDLQADPRVDAVVEQLEALARTGEDRPVVRPPPLPTDPGQAADYALDRRQEHVAAVRPAKAHDVVHPEKKVVINQQRTLSEIAAEAGLSMGDFKALNAGDRRARTMLAARLVDHMDRGVRLRPDTARGALPIRAPTGTQGRSAPVPSELSDGPLGLNALPGLEPDGSLIEPATPIVAPASPRPLLDDDGGMSLLDGLPALDADGSVLVPDRTPTRAAAQAKPEGSFAELEAQIRGAKPGLRTWLALLTLALVAAALWVVLANATW